MKRLAARARAALAFAVARVLGLDLEDLETLQTFAYGSMLVLAGAAVAGFAIRVLLATSGLGG